MGASAGTIALTQVGCAEFGSFTAATMYRTSTGIRVSSEAEGIACDRAQRSRSVADVNALMSLFPQGRCIAPILNALPGQTLGALSPEAIAGLSGLVIRGLSSRTRSRLPVAVTSSRDDSDERGSRY